jgi:hypothetical protein
MIGAALKEVLAITGQEMAVNLIKYAAGAF